MKSAEPDAARKAFVSKQQLQTAPLWPSKVPTQSPVSPFLSMGLESEPHTRIVYIRLCLDTLLQMKVLDSNYSMSSKYVFTVYIWIEASKFRSFNTMYLNWLLDKSDLKSFNPRIGNIQWPDDINSFLPLSIVHSFHEYPIAKTLVSQEKLNINPSIWNKYLSNWELRWI